MGLGRFLNLDRMAGRFNQWIGAAAMADKAAAGTAGGFAGSPEAVDPSAVVGVLGEIEREYSGSDARREEEELPPLNLEPLKQQGPTPQSNETPRRDD
jgi:hypothetical protein